jgi:hypothetical protein
MVTTSERQHGAPQAFRRRTLRVSRPFPCQHYLPGRRQWRLSLIARLRMHAVKVGLTHYNVLLVLLVLQHTVCLRFESVLA